MARLIIIVGLVLAFVGGTHHAAAKTTPLDGRLGGSPASFETRFGKPFSGDANLSGYESKGYGVIVVSYVHSNAVSIVLEPPRATHATTNEADPADWTEAQWRHVVNKFLPTDATITDPLRQSKDGRQEGECQSKSLGQAFSTSAWKKLHASGKPGDCHFLLSPDNSGNIYHIEISIGQSGSLNQPAIGDSQTSNTTAASSSGFSDDEKAYLAQVSKISFQVSAAITDIGDRFGSSDIGSQDWTIHLAADFVAVRDGYQQALALTPPPVFVNEHALFVEALSYANDATYDYEAGITNLDADSIAAGNAALEKSATLIEQANAELDRIKKDRGV